VLDSWLGGGFDKPSTILFFSDHPTERRLFAEQFVVTGLKEGEKCLYVDFYRAPALARRDLRKFGTYPESHLMFVDGVSAQLLIPTAERYVVRNSDSFDEIMDSIEDAVRDTKPDRIVIDSMEFLADRFPFEGVLERWRRLSEVARSTSSVVCYMFLNWLYGQKEVQRMNDSVDYSVEFQSKLRTGVLEHYMRIRDHRPGSRATNWIPFTFREVVGLSVYFPRILVTGPPDAGKSTVVHRLCQDAMSVDRLGTTVAFDYGNVQTSGLEAELFGTPGQERFEFMFQIFARQVNGVLLVVDGTREEDLPRAKQILAIVGPELPLVVLANKTDLPGRLEPGRIREVLGLPPTVPVVPTVATEGTGLLDALTLLAESIVGVR
jgi:small GTP-binding protein